MPKSVRCPGCGRMNSLGNSVCSKCGAQIDFKKQLSISKEQIKKEFPAAIPLLDSSIRQKQKFGLEFFKPNEIKLFLFINLSFASLFLLPIAKNTIIFSIFFYPSLYSFSCHWASKTKIDWKSFIFQFILFILIFFLIFSLL